MAHLPIEVLSCIIGLVDDRDTLSRLCRCSKALHELALPHLYRSIEVREWRLSPEDWLDDGLSCHDRNKLWSKDSAPWIGLIDLTLLLFRRLTQARLVKELKITRHHLPERSRAAYKSPCAGIWGDFCRFIDDPPDESVRELLPYVKRLVQFQPDAMLWVMEMASHRFAEAFLAILITCLPNLETFQLGVASRGAVAVSMDGDIVPWNSRLKTVLHWSRRIGCLNNLRSLIIEDEALDLDTHIDEPLYATISAASGLSNLTDLTLHNVCLQAFRRGGLGRFPRLSNLSRLAMTKCTFATDMDDYGRIIDKCPPLKTFVFRPSLRWNANDEYPDSGTPFHPDIEAANVLAPLQKHQATLESLCLGWYTLHDANAGVEPALLPIYEFTSLRRLHLSHQYAQWLARTVNGFHETCFPPGLEELRLMDLDPAPVDGNPPYLKTLINSKQSDLKNLRRIIIEVSLHLLEREEEQDEWNAHFETAAKVGCDLIVLSYPESVVGEEDVPPGLPHGNAGCVSGSDTARGLVDKDGDFEDDSACHPGKLTTGGLKEEDNIELKLCGELSEDPGTRLDTYATEVKSMPIGSKLKSWRVYPGNLTCRWRQYLEM